MIEQRETKAYADGCKDRLLDGLQACVTVADENGRIIYLNDLAAEHYGDRGGRGLLGTHLDDCHNAQSQTKIRDMYARFHGGDLTPIRYHERGQHGTARSIVLIPLFADEAFGGLVELMWDEHDDFVFER